MKFLESFHRTRNSVKNMSAILLLTNVTNLQMVLEGVSGFVSTSISFFVLLLLPSLFLCGVGAYGERECKEKKNVCLLGLV